MIKLSEILNEKGPCWKGYKQIGMKEKDGRQVPNCVPINELGEKDYIYEEILKYFDSNPELQNKILDIVNNNKQYDDDKIVKNREDLENYIRQ
jgi:hypothetical protein